MDEDITIINSNTKNQKIKDFFIKFKKQIVSVFVFLILLVFSYFIYGDFQKKKQS